MPTTSLRPPRPRHLRPSTAAALAGACLLAACASGGSDTAYSIEVSPSSLAFTADQGGALPPSQRLTITFKGDGLLVGYPAGVSPPSWLGGTVSGSGSSGVATVSVITTALNPGNYATTLRLVTGKSDGSKIVYRDVPVTYTVRAPLSVSPFALRFEAVEGEAPPSQELTLRADTLPVDWTLSVEAYAGGPSDWLVLPATAGKLETSGAKVTVGAAARPPGDYAATLVLRQAGGTVRGMLAVTYKVLPNLQAGAAALTFASIEGVTPLTQELPLAAARPPAGYGLTVSPVNGGPTDWLVLPSTSGTVGAAGVEVAVQAAARPPGRYAATIVVRNDAGDARASVAVAYDVDRAASLTGPATATISHAARLSDLDLPFMLATRHAAAAGAACAWHATSSVPWLTVVPATGTLASDTPLVARLDPAGLWALPNGEHPATVTLTFDGGCATTVSASTTVRLALTPAFAAIPTASFRVAFDTTPAQLTRIITVGHDLGEAFAANGGWAATSDGPWASVAKAGPAALTLSLLPAGLGPLPAGPHSATVSIAPTSSRVAATSFEVALDMALPKVDHVAPYLTWVGRAARVIVRGSGFGGASLPVKFGAEVVAGTVVSASELWATAPAQGVPGRIPVTVENPLGLDRGRPELVVLAEPGYGAATVKLDKAFYGVTLDPERKAVLLVDDQSEVRRLRFEGGSWASDPFPIAAASGIAVSLDGKELLVTSGTFHSAETLVRLDPSTLAVKGSSTFDDVNSRYSLVAGFNDGRVMLVDSDQWAETRWYPSLQTGPFLDAHGARMLLTRDRSRAVFRSTSTSGPFVSFDASEDVFRAQFTPSGGDLNSWGISEDGTRLTNATTVYDREFTFLGTVALPEPSVALSTLSPAGDLYTLASGTTNWVLRRTDVRGAGPYAPDVAPVPLTLPLSHIVMQMRVSEDGSTLFLLHFSTATLEYFFQAVPLG